jgi:hypothetical protein
MKDADKKKLLAKNDLERPTQKIISKKKVTDKPTDSTKKATSTKKPLFPFFKKKKN